jgi:uncharacterized membrane protein
VETIKKEDFIMLKSKELRVRAWDSLKGKYWMAFAVIIVTGLIGSFCNMFVSFGQNLSEVLGLVDPAEMDSTMAIGALVLNGVVIVSTIIGALLNIFIASPITVGVCNYFIKNTDSKPAFKEAFSGFKVKYGRNVGTLLLAGIKLVLWTFLFIIPGIIKTYEYAIIPYILADDPEISRKDAFKKAKEMMKGNKWRLFKLELSFFGWFLLCVLTLGLGTFFLLPYINAANAEFYAELKNN